MNRRSPALVSRAAKLTGRPGILLLQVAQFVVVLSVFSSAASACPFCAALEPTWVSRREAADVVALAEVLSRQGTTAEARVHRTSKGPTLVPSGAVLSVPVDAETKAGSLLLLFGDREPGELTTQLQWTALPVNETSYAYFMQAPVMRKPAPERLHYFARYLEHPDKRIAADAYQEFGHAPFAEVAAAADALPLDKMRAWLVDERVPAAHKGFYGLALGFATSDEERRQNAALLGKLIAAPEDDFRAGFDGILGGYLRLQGEAGLAEIETRYLANPRSADGDLRHALSALRAYRECGQEISVARLCQALRPVLARPEFADRVITDLARWQDWSAAEEIAGLYQRPEYAQPPVRRAIVGYLLACPTPEGAKALRRLRSVDPAGVEAAERVLSSLGGARQ